MAIAAYYAWNSAGRPLEPARPVRDIVERLKVAFPKGAAASLFSWYADEAHYQADHPQDHTPYSQTPWPVTPNPYPVVFATDVMHRPDLGVDCFKLFDYWIVEARAGRMPWCKYLIWEGWIYDVRAGWAPRGASDHFDHIHISTRTDHQNTTLGAWPLVPGKGDDMPVLIRSRQSGGVYVANYIERRHVKSQDEWNMLKATLGATVDVDEAQLDWYGADVSTGAGGLVLTDEDLAKIEAAAEKGAKEGSPSEQQLVDAAEKGANLAEDS